MKSRITIASLLLVCALMLPAAALTMTAAEVENVAPIAENLTLTTYKGVAINGRFAATDPEGDAVVFQVIDTPARGQVTVDEADPSAFCYTPYEGKKGKDSFTYVAVDAQGNTSEPATVKITIQKQSTKVTYSDLSGNAAHYAALRLAEEDIYVGRQVGSLYCFDPTATFSREEFLALAMTAAGLDPISDINVTGFSDDPEISAWAKGYVSAALVDGAIQGGVNAAGEAVFDASRPITTMEAAVLLDAMLDVGDVPSPVFASAYGTSVPAWAAQAVLNMETVEVLQPDLTLSEPLTRAEGAQMLSGMLDVLESRKASRWFW